MIYDYEQITSCRKFEKVWDMPDGDYRMTVRGEGMKWVLVNGRPIFCDSECTGILPGQLVYNGPVNDNAGVETAIAAE